VEGATQGGRQVVRDEEGIDCVIVLGQARIDERKGTIKRR
jgi:hypothetical protein